MHEKFLTCLQRYTRELGYVMVYGQGKIFEGQVPLIVHLQGTQKINAHYGNCLKTILDLHYIKLNLSILKIKLTELKLYF